jgi:hypothetical protein
MAETTRPALEVLHEVVDAWLRRNERRAATEAAFLTRDRWFESGSLQRRESGANLSLAGIRLPTSRSRGFRGCAGRDERRGRQRRAGRGQHRAYGR